MGSGLGLGWAAAACPVRGVAARFGLAAAGAGMGWGWALVGGARAKGEGGVLLGVAPLSATREGLKLREEVRELLGQRRLKEGRNKLERLCDLDDADADAWVLLGQVCILLGDAARAEHAYARALFHRPLDAVALGASSALMQQQGRGEEAARVLEDRLWNVEHGAVPEGVDPGEAEAGVRMVLAQLHVSMGESGRALDEFDRVLAKRPDDYRAHLGKGLVLRLREERLDEADACMAEAARLAPSGVLEDFVRAADQGFR